MHDIFSRPKFPNAADKANGPDKEKGVSVLKRLSQRRHLAWLATLPSWNQLFGDAWRDLLTMTLVGVVGLVFHFDNVVIGGNDLSFMIWNERNEFVAYEVGKPRLDNIIHIWLSALLAILVPSVFFVLAQIRVRSVYDLYVAFWMNLRAIVVGSLFQVMNKSLIGGLRPHFLAVCEPNPSVGPGDGAGYHGLYFTWEICQGAKRSWIKDAVKSWPSGHTTVAFAGFTTLSLYLNGKLKIFSDERAMVWKLFLFFAPLLGACLIGGAMILDHSHHWYDVFGGAVIGICSAFTGYRANYASIWDYRFNHIPLQRAKVRWNHRGDAAPSGHFVYSTAPESRFPDFAHGHEMKWAAGGAPGDAAEWNDVQRRPGQQGRWRRPTEAAAPSYTSPTVVPSSEVSHIPDSHDTLQATPV
ncbi:phosphatidic acid phosphatase type 2/haloperoxidase [Schizophyllum amplum]|uniref:Phosphatidic acid phosphatase type 2/haloperoxidase n=1 Tax=Schizophyllum amplum TaxID=97359 RepID=A0A550CYE4_9AGAR|nr:phosphatidic acid phosphatase type 2/haloperoxidase [Auriculariopsis ampla]